MPVLPKTLLVDAIPEPKRAETLCPRCRNGFFEQAHRAGETALGPVDLELPAYPFRLLSYPFG